MLLTGGPPPIAATKSSIYQFQHVIYGLLIARCPLWRSVHEASSIHFSDRVDVLGHLDKRRPPFVAVGRGSQECIAEAPNADDFQGRPAFHPDQRGRHRLYLD